MNRINSNLNTIKTQFVEVINEFTVVNGQKVSWTDSIKSLSIAVILCGSIAFGSYLINESRETVVAQTTVVPTKMVDFKAHMDQPAQYFSNRFR